MRSYIEHHRKNINFVQKKLSYAKPEKSIVATRRAIKVESNVKGTLVRSTITFAAKIGVELNAIVKTVQCLKNNITKNASSPNKKCKWLQIKRRVRYLKQGIMTSIKHIIKFKIDSNPVTTRGRIY